MLLSPSQYVPSAVAAHLLGTIASDSDADALAFNSRGSLFEAFWQRKRQTHVHDDEDVRFSSDQSGLLTARATGEILSVQLRCWMMGMLIEDANVLISEHVLASDSGRRSRSFTKGFFWLRFARMWVSRKNRLLTSCSLDEQALFRRAQVRQILQHLYERECDRFSRAEVEAQY